MHLLGREHEMDSEAVVQYLLGCQHASGVHNQRHSHLWWALSRTYFAGGFGGSTGHDPHITYTHYAVLCLALCDRLADLDTERVVTCQCHQPSKAKHL